MYDPSLSRVDEVVTAVNDLKRALDTFNRHRETAVSELV